MRPGMIFTKKVEDLSSGLKRKLNLLKSIKSPGGCCKIKKTRTEAGCVENRSQKREQPLQGRAAEAEREKGNVDP